MKVWMPVSNYKARIVLKDERRGCVKLTVGLDIFIGIARVVFVPLLEASTLSVNTVFIRISAPGAYLVLKP